eukprot:NODE_299_length_10456_cov_1.003669.p9 type:complete len:184 gc:universal NODE_299_length_10456_cov_1.003669:2708-3259(+)
MENSLFQLKLSAKQLVKASKKCEKEEKQEKLKAKKAIQQGNNDGARLYAANAIRKKTEALNLLKLSSRVDAMASRVQTAITMKQTTQNLQVICRDMDRALGKMDLNTMTMLMDRFEHQNEQIDITTNVMEDSINTKTPNELAQVDELLQQIADEAGLEIKMNPVKNEEPAAIDLEQRLAKLRQ